MYTNVNDDGFTHSPTRQEIVRLLKRQGAMTVQELSEQLGLTSMGIRRHLLVLQKEHTVQVSLIRNRRRKPVSAYRLTQEAERLFPTAYDSLALELMQGVSELFGEDYLCKLLRQQSEKQLSRYQPIDEAGELEQRIEALVRIRRQEGYLPRAERMENGDFVLEEAHCPVLRAAVAYDGLCRCEVQLLADVLGAQVDRLACMAEGDERCRFCIKAEGSVSDCEVVEA